MVGTARPQNGHWKSLQATTVTGAEAGPLTGASPKWMSYFLLGSSPPPPEGDGSGWFIQTSATSLPYLSSSPFTVGSDRLQNGHWKSLNSTIVTLVAFAPRRRSWANGTTFFEPPSGAPPPPDGATGFCFSSMA